MRLAVLNISSMDRGSGNYNNMFMMYRPPYGVAIFVQIKIKLITN